jgi:predicted AlkP superfamily phosphohydrolase/phosphomutase
VNRVIVVGFDGLEPSIIERMVAAGELPNMGRLAGDRVGRVATTAPAQTPVAWSTFATGLNPGGHGIFDFIRRDPATYQPDLALNRYEQKSAWLPPRAVNDRDGTAVWDRLAGEGIPSTILRCPCSYPAEIKKGRLLSGLGVPDLRGGLGTPTLLTAVPDAKARDHEQVATLLKQADGSWNTTLPGPRNPRDRSRLDFELKVRRAAAGDPVTICSSGEPRELQVHAGEWSDWLRVAFRAGIFQSLHGMVRFRLLADGEAPTLYASPINFDPARPPFPISDPAGYAEELTRELGTFYTTGMVEDHVGFENGRLDEEAFLDQCDEVWREREAMLERELGRTGEGLVYCLFDTPDRVQHLFWRYGEPGHPANRHRPPRAGFTGTIADQYRRADEILGRVLAVADDRTLLITLSDHGFGSFRRGVDLNAWLAEKGLLAVLSGEPFPRNVDWRKTRAYALGLGGIYLNLAGREGHGTVDHAEAAALKTQIAEELTGLVDPEHQQVAVRRVASREELYRGSHVQAAPDLQVLFGAGYRVSWESSSGGVAPSVFLDNTRTWSGDHTVDPALVPGFLLMNRPFDGEGARLEDLAPTILAALGCQDVAGLEGRGLLR